MEKFYYKNILIGLKIRKFPDGSIPHTGKDSAEEAVGLLTLKYKKGTVLKAHVHKDRYRVTTHLQEAFIVVKGQVKVSLYGPDGVFFKQIELQTGQLFLAINGGHKFDVTEDCEIFEVKNGPFREDKVYLDS